MKKGLILALIASLLFSMSSCSNKTGEDEKSSNKTERTVNDNIDEDDKDATFL